MNTAQGGSPGKAVFSGGMEIHDGGVNVSDADVAAAGVSLVSHITEGVMPGAGLSKHPQGGSEESPGTGAISQDSLSETDKLLHQATHLTVLARMYKPRAMTLTSSFSVCRRLRRAWRRKNPQKDRRGFICMTCL